MSVHSELAKAYAALVLSRTPETIEGFQQALNNEAVELGFGKLDLTERFHNLDAIEDVEEALYDLGVQVFNDRFTHEDILMLVCQIEQAIKA